MLNLNLSKCFFSLSIITFMIASRASAQTYATYNPANGHYYETVEVPGGLTWQESSDAAQKRVKDGIKGHLVTITSQAEYDFLDTHSHVREFFIGAYCPIGETSSSNPKQGWHWVTGEPWSYERWGTNEPKKPEGKDRFGHIWTAAKTWTDTGADRKLDGYVVEYDTKPDPSKAEYTAAREVTDFLTKVQKKYKTFNSYSETVEVKLTDFYKSTLDTARAEFTWKSPNLFRLVGTGILGKVTAVSDGKNLFMINRLEPDTYVYRPLTSLSQAISEGLQVMSPTFQSPTPLGLLSDGPPSISNYPWLKNAKMGELIEGEDPVQTVYSDIKITFDDEPGINVTVKMHVSLKDMIVRQSEMSFRYQTDIYTIRETHKNIEINGEVTPDQFTYRIPQNAERVRRLTDGTATEN